MNTEQNIAVKSESSNKPKRAKWEFRRTGRTTEDSGQLIAMMTMLASHVNCYLPGPLFATQRTRNPERT